MVAAPALVVLLTGPSGSGKSSVASRSGLPVLSLDSFYKDGDDPSLPRDGSLVDWDDPASWDLARAAEAVRRLATTRRAEVPRYDLARSRAVGTRTLHLGAAPAFVAEGVFAAELVPSCREHGVLADALCLRQHRAVSFSRRLRRDLRERRKPPAVLVRRGVALLRAENAVVTRQVTAGTYPCSAEEALFRIHLAAHARRPARDVVPDDVPTTMLPVAEAVRREGSGAGTAPPAGG